MNTFKNFLLSEAQVAHSLAESIIIQELNPPFVFTPTMMDRLEYSIKDVTAFHVTSADYIAGVTKSQGSKSSQLSVFLNVNKKSANDLFKGVETEGGIAIELKGQLDAYFSVDAFTARLKGGRRSVLIGPDSDWGNNVKFYMETIGGNELKKMMDTLIRRLQFDMQILQAETLNEYLKPLFLKTFPILKSRVKRTWNWFAYFEELQRMWQDGEDIVKGYDTGLAQGPYHFIKILPNGGRILQKIVRDYLTGVEDLLKENPGYKPLFLMPGFDSKAKSGPSYDEGILSNFKIVKLHIYDHDMIGDQTKDELAELFESEGFSVQIWDDYIDLSKYVMKKTDSFAEIVKKKIT